jgi:hypothetical protein
MITFKMQFDKLTEAYISNKVNPFSDCNCFVGNLLNNNRDWADDRYWNGSLIEQNLATTFFSSNRGIKSVLAKEAESSYMPEEILCLERMFLKTYLNNNHNRRFIEIDADDCGTFNEDALFLAFEKTLDLLKLIHESKGEVVEPFFFTKREPVTA